MDRKGDSSKVKGPVVCVWERDTGSVGDPGLYDLVANRRVSLRFWPFGWKSQLLDWQQTDHNLKIINRQWKCCWNLSTWYSKSVDVRPGWTAWCRHSWATVLLSSSDIMEKKLFKNVPLPLSSFVQSCLTWTDHVTSDVPMLVNWKCVSMVLWWWSSAYIVPSS